MVCLWQRPGEEQFGTRVSGPRGNGWAVSSQVRLAESGNVLLGTEVHLFCWCAYHVGERGVGSEPFVMFRVPLC